MKTDLKTGYRIMLGLALIGLLLFGLTSSAWAADFRGGDRVVISADEVIDDDLFVSGNRVEVNGIVKGDLFASGNEVIVNGTVEGSLFLAGQTLAVNGPVAGSVYGGGYALTIGSETDIGRNLYFGGFSLTTDQGSTIGRGLHVGGYQSILNGEVAHDVNVGGAALQLNGIVGGDVLGSVGNPEDSAPSFMPAFPGAVPAITPGLQVSDDAEVGGVVDVEISERGQFAGSGWGDRGGFGLGRVVSSRIGEFIALLIVGGLLLYFWPSLVRRVSSEAQERPLPSAGRGCVVTLLFPIGVVIAGIVILILALLGGLVTLGQLLGEILGLGGATLGLVTVVFAFVFFTVTKAIIAFVVGRLILVHFASHMQPGWWTDFASLALGAFIYEILRAIPILGWVVALIVILVGLGAIYIVVRDRIRPSPEVILSPEATT